MIGIYDYTVILTYLSLASGVTGIIFTTTGIGHPEVGIFFLMVSGILDAFDGRVARTKKGRTKLEKDFGIQIDSLADMICFGVLPATIGLAQLRISGIFTELVRRRDYDGNYAMLVLLLMIAVIYVLAALIRLAYFNATTEIREEEAKQTGTAYFTGLPVTAAALVFPLEMLIHFYVRWDLTIIYFILMLIMAVAFLLNVKVRKPGKKALSAIITIGTIEFILSVIVFHMY